MENMVNYGIDLGTTNSIIAQFIKGDVEIFKSPIDWRETLPSVVGFKKDKIIIGSKAKEYMEKDPHNVVGGFKRKMGTTETFPIESIGHSLTPIMLSSYVLKELKTFVRSESNIRAAVITIPACFDTIQSNATKEAGYHAGFKQVELLQEPIAASLAYANKSKSCILDGKWLVYDLGGGTFDVALVAIHEGEMKIIDHEGDNYLGGRDLDQLIVEKMIIPYLEKHHDFSNLCREMTSASGKHNRSFYRALHHAEQAKIQVSSRTSTDIEFDIIDDSSAEQEICIAFSRTDFENIIKGKIDDTVELVKRILVKNSLMSSDIKFILMVGGSTFIPLVRKRVEELLEIPVNCEIDPTTAIAIGAAYYAGTKPLQIKKEKLKKPQKLLSIKCAYQKATNEMEEFFAAKVEGNVENMFYRIMREDGGYDTSIKPLTNKITEDLPLVKDSYNFFTLKIYDDKNNEIETDVQKIGIAQGKYSIAGQPLPEDICLELDDIDAKVTYSRLLFTKNSVLPLRNKVIVELNRTITKGGDSSFRINLLEGDRNNRPESSKSIGYLSISGKQLKNDVVKGTDIEITVEVSESRDLTISAYITMVDQEFTKIFTGQERHVTISHLVEDVKILLERAGQEMNEANEVEDYELAGQLNKIKKEISGVYDDAEVLAEDDSTDRKFQLDDKKRKMSQELDKVTQDKRFSRARCEYYDIKQKCFNVIQSDGNDFERRHYEDIIKNENIFIGTRSFVKTKESGDALKNLMYSVLWRTPTFLLNAYKYFEANRHRLNDQEQVKSLIEAGKIAVENKNFDRLREINSRLYDLMPDSERESFKGTGLS